MQPLLIEISKKIPIKPNNVQVIFKPKLAIDLFLVLAFLMEADFDKMLFSLGFDTFLIFKLSF
jgi:hypothetical protein